MALHRDKSGRTAARVAAIAARLEAVENKPQKKARKKNTGPTPTELAERVVRLTPWATGESPDPSEEGAALVVLMWALLHGRVLGISPVDEIAGGRWFAACKTAEELVSSKFEGDYEEGAEFVRWAWSHEKKIVIPYRKSNHVTGRLTWQTCFSPTKVINYRVHTRSDDDERS